jgi:hypothetical protein
MIILCPECGTKPGAPGSLSVPRGEGWTLVHNADGSHTATPSDRAQS